MYLGYVRAGVLGATLVSLAFILPSFLMVFYMAFKLPTPRGGTQALAVAPLVLSQAGGAGAMAVPVTAWRLLGFFGKAGAMVFGSGLAIVPFLYGGVVKEYHWLTERQFMDAVAVAMITPVPVVITVAFIGYLLRGPWGASLAAIGVFLHKIPHLDRRGILLLLFEKYTSLPWAEAPACR